MPKIKVASQRFARAYVKKSCAPEHASAMLKLLDVAAVHGISVKITRQEIRYAWDGRGTLRIPRLDGPELVSDLAHELAHFAVSTRTLRKVKEFGLGASTHSAAYPEPVVPASVADREEAIASFYGMMLEAWADVSPAYTWSAHDWRVAYGSHVVDRAWRAVVELQRRGLLYNVTIGDQEKFESGFSTEKSLQYRICEIANEEVFRMWKPLFAELAE